MTIEARRNFLTRSGSLVSSSLPNADPIEIIPDRLYFATIDGLPVNDSGHFYFRTDEGCHYESFYEDFGPMNLAVLYKYCTKLQRRLKMLNLSKKRIIHYASSTDQKQRVNTAYLIGSFAIIYLGKFADDVWRLFEKASPFIPFRDAAFGLSTYDLHLRDVFAGVEKAVKYKWLNFEEGCFNAEEYEFYEKVENGDFNWIIPGKILSFCSPHHIAGLENGYPYHSPETYFPYFRKHNVSTIVRLNKKLYDARRFTSAGFQHADLFFIDGSCPNDQIVRLFIGIVEQAPGAVAIHCKAGLGRTGTLIACWMMMKFRITAAESIAWTRICRPGSVIGPQQKFLIDNQEWCWRLHGGGLPSISALSSVLAQPTRPAPIVPVSVNGLVSQVDEIRISANNAGTRFPIRSQSGSQSLPFPFDTESNTQGDRLRRIKANRANTRPPIGLQSGESETSVVKTGTIKRIFPGGGILRVSSMKESDRGKEKANGMGMAVVGLGPVRKAAKRETDPNGTASAINLCRSSSDRGIVVSNSISNRYWHQKPVQSTAASSKLTMSATEKSTDHKRSPIKESSIPLSISGIGRLDASRTKRNQGENGGRRSMQRSPSAFNQSAIATKFLTNVEKTNKQPMTSSYFLRRRSQTMAATAQASNGNDNTTAATLSQVSKRDASVGSALPRRASYGTKSKRNA